MSEMELLKLYPKKRVDIGDEYKNILDDAYANSREGKTLFTRIALKLEQWMHRKVAKTPQSYPVLEIGAGTLNHLKFESISGDYYVVEPQEMLYAGKTQAKAVKKIFSRIEDVPLDLKFNRIISIAALEHIEDLPMVIARSVTLLAPNGEFRAGIPTEGGLLWYLAWRFGTGLGFWLKYKKSYAPFQRYEHINNSDEIEGLVKIFFEDVKCIRYPFNCRHLSFYTYIEAKTPKISRATSYLKEHCFSTI